MKKTLILLSLLLNVFIALPALLLVTNSSATQFFLHERLLAPNLGKLSIAFIGDSITEGGGVWAWRLGRFNFDTRNLGRASFTTQQMRFEVQDAIKSGARYAFVMSGRNDEDKSASGAEKSFAEYQRYILDPLLTAGVQPVVELTLYKEHDAEPVFVQALNRRLTAYAEEHRLLVVDLNPILCPGNSLLQQYTSDGIHLSPQAYEVWQREVRKVVTDLAI